MSGMTFNMAQETESVWSRDSMRLWRRQIEKFIADAMTTNKHSIKKNIIYFTNNHFILKDNENPSTGTESILRRQTCMHMFTHRITGMIVNYYYLFTATKCKITTTIGNLINVV